MNNIHMKRRSYISKWNKKRNNYTIMYNERMNTNDKNGKEKIAYMKE